LNIKEMVNHCYGTIIDDTSNFNTECLGNSQNLVKGITISINTYNGCTENNITIIPPNEFTTGQVFHIPVYQNNKEIICPGKLHIYT